MTKKTVLVAMSCMLALTMCVGCATSGGAKAPESKAPAAKATSDKDEVMAGVNAWKAGIIAKNVDQLMAIHSESYKDPEGRGKADLKAFIADAISNGYLDNIKVETDKAAISVNGASATAGPVTLEGSMGTMALTLNFAKEGSAWKIVGISQA